MHSLSFSKAFYCGWKSFGGIYHSLRRRPHFRTEELQLHSLQTVLKPTEITDGDITATAQSLRNTIQPIFRSFREQEANLVVHSSDSGLDELTSGPGG
jgi:hypothetical protein